MRRKRPTLPLLWDRGRDGRAASPADVARQIVPLRQPLRGQSGEAWPRAPPRRQHGHACGQPLTIIDLIITLIIDLIGPQRVRCGPPPAAAISHCHRRGRGRGRRRRHRAGCNSHPTAYPSAPAPLPPGQDWHHGWHHGWRGCHGWRGGGGGGGGGGAPDERGGGLTPPCHGVIGATCAICAGRGSVDELWWLEPGR